MNKILPFIFVALVVFGSNFEASAQSQRKLVFGYGLMQAPSAPLWIAQQEGLFSKYGIDAELVFLRSTSLVTAAVLSGSIDINATGGTALVTANAGDAGLKVLAAFSSKLTHVLVVQPAIMEPKDLTKKRIGVVSIGGTQWITTKLGLQHLGLDESRDQIRIIGIGEQTVLKQAVEAGYIDGAFLNGVIAHELKQKGFRSLVELSHAKIPTVSMGIVVRKTFLQQHSDVIDNVLKALIEGVAFVLSPLKKPIVIKTLMRALKISNPSVVEAGYPYLLQDLDLKLYPSVEGLRNLQRFMIPYYPRVADLKVEDMIDSSALRRLEESGFIDKIYEKYGLK